jgi:hypothetical protein
LAGHDDAWWKGVNSNGGSNEFDVTLNGNCLFVRPIDPMSMRALGVVSDPARFKSARVEFRPSTRMYPDGLTPLGHAREVGFAAIELLIGSCIIAESPSGGAILEPSRKLKCFGPEVLR